MAGKRAQERLLLPVRRKLMCICTAYLAGIFLAQVISLPALYAFLLCAFLFVWAALRLVRRKSALFCFAVLFFLAGNLKAGTELLFREAPSEPYAQICGTISAIERPYRVRLSDAEANGVRYKRDVVVTLMLDKEQDAPEEPKVGQHVSGTGRLFAQEEKRNPGGIDRRIRALCEGYELSGYILPGWRAEGEPVFSWKEAFRQTKERLLAHIGSLFGDRAALFQGIMLGEKRGLDDEFAMSMRLTGIVHILTVSGMHLGLMAQALSALLKRMKLGGPCRFVLLSAFLGAFTGLTGCAAGTVRAMVMALMRELARIRGKAYEPLTALSAAALSMTLVRPLWALSASFQFSFFVVFAIQLLSQGIRRALDRRIVFPHRMQSAVSALAVSMGAQLGALPMQLLFYGYVPLLSLPMNLLTGLLMPVFLLGGWGCALIGAVFPKAGLALAGLLGDAEVLFERITILAAELPGSIVRLPAPGTATVLLFLLVMALLSSRIRFGKRRKAALAAVVLALAVSYLPRFCPAARYVQLDVGQGDGAVLRKGRHAVLVDVGPADSYAALHYLRHEGLFLDAVILSHPDEDHAGALGVILDSEVEIPCLYLPSGAFGESVSAAVQEAMHRISERSIPVYAVSRGDVIDTPLAVFDVLSPMDWMTGSNERSLLLYTQMEDVTMLTAGDLPETCEPETVTQADILKVAHHGSAGATSEMFLEMASPETAIISVGENWYGHPTRRVLDALHACGSDILRTDESGCITIWLEDGTYRIERFLDDENHRLKGVMHILSRVFADRGGAAHEEKAETGGQRH